MTTFNPDSNILHCFECNCTISRSISYKAFSANPYAFKGTDNALAVEIGSRHYCVDCWTFNKVANKSNQASDVLDVVSIWTQLNERCRWYTTRTWKIQFTFLTIAGASAMFILMTPMPQITRIASSVGLLAFSFYVWIFRNYSREHESAAIRQMTRLELHPDMVRVSGTGMSEHHPFNRAFSGVYLLMPVVTFLLFVLVVAVILAECGRFEGLIPK